MTRSVLALFLVALLGCKPSAPPPPAPAAPAPAPAHSHAGHAGHAAKPAMKSVARLGVESLDIYADSAALHLLLASYPATNQPPVLLHQRSTDGGVTWSAPARVDAGATTPKSPHRGMDAQLAASGSKLIALWGTAGTGLFGSGPIATALSTDGGATWKPGPNPADDGLTTGHGFVDIAADAAGTFHLVWLDSRDGKQGLRYANSKDGGQTWSKNTTLKPETCECCWNTLTLGPDGSVHALFRDKNPRDMAVISSTDRGANWSAPAKVGTFNWDFAGCPHVGGGLAVGGSSLHALIWTGATGHGGAYHVSSPDRGQTWSAPQRLGDADARRGDLATRGAQHLAAVWDRVSDGESGVFSATSADAGKTWSAPKPLSSPGINAAYPRIVPTAGGYRAFWTESTPGQPSAWKSAALTQ